MHSRDLDQLSLVLVRTQKIQLIAEIGAECVGVGRDEDSFPLLGKMPGAVQSYDCLAGSGAPRHLDGAPERAMGKAGLGGMQEGDP